jgi:hypothetical protein
LKSGRRDGGGRSRTGKRGGDDDSWRRRSVDDSERLVRFGDDRRIERSEPRLKALEDLLEFLHSTGRIWSVHEGEGFVVLGGWRADRRAGKSSQRSIERDKGRQVRRDQNPQLGW